MKRRTFLGRSGAAASAFAIGGCSALRGDKYANWRPSGTVPTRRLGKTGIEVSMLGFGSHLVPELIAKPGYRDTMIKRGFEGGITLFDVYDHSNYKQFKPMGDSLRDFRKDAVVSLCAVKPTDELQTEIEGALDDFHTDYIDLYRLYTVDDDRMRIMERNRDAGNIRAIGVVSHDAGQMTDYIDRYGDVLDYVMIIYNFHHNIGQFTNDSYHPNDYSALIPRCERMGLGILGIKPMGSDFMVAFAREKGFFKDPQASVAQAMLKYVYKTGDIDCTMPAMNSMEELAVNLESAYSPTIRPYERTILDDLSRMASQTKSAYLPPHYKWLENWSTRTSMA